MHSELPISPADQVCHTTGDPCVIVIFGASGDLTSRKLIPALFHLAGQACLSKTFRIIGVSLEDWSSQTFREKMRAGTETSQEILSFESDEWQHFTTRLEYLSGDFNDADTFSRLSSLIHDMPSPMADNRLYYLATPPAVASVIAKGLALAGLNTEAKGWARIIVEKPFGRDLASAQALNQTLAQAFTEKQIYRIDHYLGKETVQNILFFRFGNALFDPVWNRHHIDFIEITAAEPLGVGHRAGYYDQAGALRDMVANHLLQLLALTAMEPPVTFDADAVRDKKIEVWRSIRPIKADDIASHVVRGQYAAGTIDGEAVHGYKDEQGVDHSSNTETFVALQLNIDNWRWAGVPFYLRTGKRLISHLTEIAIHFRHPPLRLFPSEENLEPNVITLRIQPRESINIAFGAKQPGQNITAPVALDFCYQSAFGRNPSSAYATLLQDAMRGDATLFTRSDGVEAQWELITPIERAWQALSGKAMTTYAAGSDGPLEADQLLARNGHKWRQISQAKGVADV